MIVKLHDFVMSVFPVLVNHWMVVFFPVIFCQNPIQISFALVRSYNVGSIVKSQGNFLWFQWDFHERNPFCCSASTSSLI